jgi:hypothetical protein
MFGRSKLLIVIPAIILIPILLGMTPLNFFQKIGSGCPLSQDRQTLKCNPCPFNSLASQQDDMTVSLAPATLEQEETSSSYGFILANNFALSNNPSNSVPLRC